MTAVELMESIFAENDSHVALMWEMGECDCKICVTLQTIRQYLERAGELEAGE